MNPLPDTVLEGVCTAVLRTLGADGVVLIITKDDTHQVFSAINETHAPTREDLTAILRALADAMAIDPVKALVE